ncbi:hypothetical protein BCR43DRAFT_169007 [Syncephalastrum racemosum]|uniref:MIT domain-containing protein n=1 Tax=Syncephalastrum racemosum TaxID=13706 RepID=A0A1X2HP91_SYNRA|nr:hypothetical protein BCR43DRAFT_169007 [Syncephalastrum racemosum]
MSNTLTLKKNQPFRKRSFTSFSVKKSLSTDTTTDANAYKPASCTPALTCLLNEALSRANLAVLYDSTGNTQEAISSYKEAMRLLDSLMSDAASKVQRERLEKIHDSYRKRLDILSITVKGSRRGPFQGDEEEQDHGRDSSKSQSPSLSTEGGSTSSSLYEESTSQPVTPSSATPLSSGTMGMLSFPLFPDADITHFHTTTSAARAEKSLDLLPSATIAPKPSASTPNPVSSSQETLIPVNHTNTFSRLRDQLKKKRSAMFGADRYRHDQTTVPSALAATSFFAAPFTSLSSFPLNPTALVRSAPPAAASCILQETAQQKEKIEQENAGTTDLLVPMAIVTPPSPPDPSKSTTAASSDGLYLHSSPSITAATSVTTIAEMRHWTLVKKLRETMVQGGRLSDRLHIPKELWYQENVTLPYLDNKLAHMQRLLDVFKRLKASACKHDASDLYQELQTVESILREVQSQQRKFKSIMDQEHLQQQRTSIMKKSSSTGDVNRCTSSITRSSSLHEIDPAAHGFIRHWRALSFLGAAPPHPQEQGTQPKQRRRTLTNSRLSLIQQKPSEDRYQTYIRTLIPLIATAQVLDEWHISYSNSVAETPAPSQVALYYRILCKINICTDLFGRILATYIISDFSTLYDAWTRSGSLWALSL